jgi:two-component system nitrate/nitrite response regulator NarL
MIKTLVISHSPVYFQGLKSLLRNEHLFLSLEIDLGRKLIEQIKKYKPGIVILHQSFFEFLTQDLIKFLFSNKKKIKLIVIGAKNKNNIDYYIKQGADAYLYEDVDQKTLLKAYEAVKKDKLYFTEEITQDLLRNISAQKDKLTDKETQLMRFIAQGFSSKEIAQHLNCSVNTVNVHKFNMKIKLNIKSNAELFRYSASLTSQ